ncbi:hypothetical protein PGT21_024861 [Puccinia graminis f. sp. tritici]|uniref:Uncharacterized protein n=1 Tax=Puccinia graminis f. sp. tritici TaxID=56615 RepID=A0A5B0QYK3_PUCGR|nr:hypothetical protein PGT21_024861 [Puccinia graminis f. sp. tritici]
MLCQKITSRYWSAPPLSPSLHRPDGYIRSQTTEGFSTPKACGLFGSFTVNLREV